jgi:hypothetical protein
MAEAIRYAVLCCSGRPLAYVDDDRPIGGPLAVTAADEQDKQTILAVDIVAGQQIDLRDNRTDPPQIGARRVPYEFAASKWGDCSLTETRWPDWHTSWTISCTRCRKRAEMRDKTLAAVADGLATELDKWLFDDERQRYVIPLGVLNLKLTRFNW